MDSKSSGQTAARGAAERKWELLSGEGREKEWAGPPFPARVILQQGENMI